MELLVISIAAFAASLLTLFSGFGLGTLLMPVVAIFFPLEIAIAITATVHLANNLFKVALLGRQANRTVLVSFGVPAMRFALIGAWLLGWLSGMASIMEYTAFGKLFVVSPIKLMIGMLILLFVALELSEQFARIALNKRFLPLGGVISGFFGGLSGHQGAFRSMFLLKAGLSKEAFVATRVMLAVMVDVSRLTVYGWGGSLQQATTGEWTLAIAASISAFIGAYAGSKLLMKVAIRGVQLMVSALLVVVALGLISGVL